MGGPGSNAAAPLPRIDAALREFTQGLALPTHLVRAIEYSLLDGGKRVRPLLAWHACEAVGGEGPASLPAAVAVELVHAFSLVHDDLPALDNDDLRRGKPTLHVHAGEPTAILAGDAMLALAFGSLLDDPRLSPAVAHALGRELAAGTMGMIAGQVYDSLGGLEDAPTPHHAVQTIHRNKTGALIRASARMGAICGLGGAGPSSKLDAVTRYAEAIGLVFQIADDLLDVEHTPEQTGKRTRKDATLGKLTYPSVLGIEGSRARIDELVREARSALEPLGPGADGLRALGDRIAHRSR